MHVASLFVFLLHELLNMVAWEHMFGHVLGCRDQTHGPMHTCLVFTHRETAPSGPVVYAAAHYKRPLRPL